MEPAVVSLCSLIAGDEREAAAAHIKNPKNTGKTHRHTPSSKCILFYRQFCVSHACHVFPENGKADSSWGQGYTQWENKERKSVVTTVGKGGTSFRALGD